MELKTAIEPDLLRVTRGGHDTPKRIDREGGNYGAGIIEGYSAITLGEASGHRMWIDAEMLAQVAAFGNARKSGIKSRFTHPGMSGDGLGTLLGRTTNFRVDGEKVFGDLHFVESSRETPNGNLADYVMSLAEETPEEFGASIVFQRNTDAETEFTAKNSDKAGRFQSPDKANKNNFPHARIAVLKASDMVDEAAANDGLFSALGRKGSLGPDTEDALLWALGMSEKHPAESLLGIHPERVREFVAGFMARHDLRVANANGSAAATPTLRDFTRHGLPRAMANEIEAVFASADDPRFEEIQKSLTSLRRELNTFKRDMQIMKGRISR